MDAIRMTKQNNIEAFLELVRAGLWEKETKLSQFGMVDYEEIMRLSEEQSVVGLVTAGLEHVSDVKVPQKQLLQFIGQTIQLEQANVELNAFLAELMSRFQNNNITALLVKGQGIAQCYERPLWRASGDIDLLLDAENYENAKVYLLKYTSSKEEEGPYSKHIGFTVGSWVVELHGTMRSELSASIDSVLDNLLKEIFSSTNVRVWKNSKVDICIPGVEYDALFVFTHFLKHFYQGGVGLRQICDWCRLLWKYEDIIDSSVLKQRICSMGLLTEWCAFGAFAVEYLGMPAETMPLYSSSKKWSQKASKIHKFILSVGNMGQNRDYSYYSNCPYFIRKLISMYWRVGDLVRHAQIFLLDSIKFFPTIMFNGISSAIKGIG